MYDSYSMGISLHRIPHGYVPSVQEYFSTVSLVYTSDYFHQGRFSCSVLTDNRVNLPFFKINGDIFQYFVISKRLYYIFYL